MAFYLSFVEKRELFHECDLDKLLPSTSHPTRCVKHHIPYRNGREGRILTLSIGKVGNVPGPGYAQRIPTSNVEQRIEPELYDAAKRASDIINLHLVGQGYWALKDKWIAIRLSDGGSDGVIYDTRRSAIAHQLHESLCYYLSFRSLAGGSKPRELAIVLYLQREAYNRGMRFTDPDDRYGGPDIAPTTPLVDYLKSRPTLGYKHK